MINSHTGTYISHYLDCYGTCRSERIFASLRNVLHHHLGMDIQPAWPDRNVCGYVTEYGIFLGELVRRQLFQKVIKYPDGTEMVPTVEIATAQLQTEAIRAMLGCGIESGRRQSPPEPGGAPAIGLEKDRRGK